MPTQNIFNLLDTWASGGGPYTSIKMNATDNDVGSASLLMDLQVGGSSKFKVDKAGTVTVGNQVVLGSSSAVNTTFSNNSMAMLGSGAGFQVYNGAFIGFSSTGTSVGTADVLLTRRAAANLRLGAADAAAPVAQTLSVQSVVAGTTNTAGANLTITGSQGTGTGAGGSIVFQVAPAGTSGTAQNALATALTINADRSVTASGNLSVSNGFGLIVSDAGGNGFLATSFSSTKVVNLASDWRLGWSSGGATTTLDLILARDAANTLALRNGANAQAFRVYNTYTDASNYERLSFFFNANIATIFVDKAGTGAARDLAIQGYGNIRLLPDNTDVVTLSSSTITVFDGKNMVFGTTNGTKIGTATGQKLGFWNATPIVQPTTAVAAATVAATGTGDVVAASTTFDGYTIPQIVKALRNAGLLA